MWIGAVHSNDFVNVDNYQILFPEKIKLHSAFPNPFNNSIRIDFTINDPGYVDIGIYDIKGKWVINLIGEHMHSGNYHIVWSGTDVSGNLVASGSYLVLMKFGSSFQTKKIK